MGSFYNIKMFEYHRRLALWSHIIFSLRDILGEQGSQWYNNTGAFPRKRVIRLLFFFGQVVISRDHVIFTNILKEFKKTFLKTCLDIHTQYEKYVDNSLIILCQVHTRKTRFNILWITLLLNFNQWRKDITGVQTTYKDFNKVKKKTPNYKKVGNTRRRQQWLFLPRFQNFLSPLPKKVQSSHWKNPAKKDKTSTQYLFSMASVLLPWIRGLYFETVNQSSRA